jgi:type II secretion system protein J
MLVVLTILSILSASLYVVFDQSMKSWKKAQSKLDIYQNTRVAFEQITRELEGAVIFYDPADDNFSMIGADANPDTLYFVTPVFTSDSGEYQLCRIGYSLTDSKLRRYMDRNVDGSGVTADLALNVTDLNFKYWEASTTDWATDALDSWHSESGGAQEGILPEAVKIEITVVEDPSMASPETRDFETVVYIANSQGQ